MATKKLILQGNIKSVLSNADLEKLTVELRDQNQKIKGVIASAETNAQGGFKLELNPYTLKRQFNGTLPEVFLVIRKDSHNLLSTLDTMVLELTADHTDIKLGISKEASKSLVPEKRELPKVGLENMLKIAGVKASAMTGIKTKFKQAGFSELKSLLTRSDKLTPAKTGLDDITLNKFKSIVKLATASGSESLSNKLVDKGFGSFSDIGAVSYDTLIKRVGKLNTTEERSVNVLYQKAQHIRAETMNQAAFTGRLKSRDGLWQLDKNKYKKPPSDDQCHCEPCENAFSPYAYLINLLEMIYYHWELSVYDLERVILQDINDLDCEKGRECLLQIELAIEVLEKSGRTRTPINNAGLNKKIARIWAKLLFDNDTNAGIALIKNLQQSSNSRAKNLANTLLGPDQELANFRKAIKELKKRSRISDLKSISEAYAKGGDSFDTALQKAYQEILGLYRTELITISRKTVEELQRELFIDLKAGLCHKTNRITFLILSLQAFILSARTGELSDFNRPDVTDSLLKNKVKGLHALPVEEASWKWLKDYSSWASAMYAFLYPENMAIPFLSEQAGKGFLDYSGTFLTNPQDRLEVFKNIYHHYFGEEAREFLRETHADLEDQYLVFLKETIGAGEGEYHSAKISVKKFMYNLSFLIEGYFESYLLSPGSRENIVLKNTLYFPLIAAYSLNKSENYESAHDWYRQLYDPTKTGSERYVFDFHNHFQESLSSREAWNNGVLDPNELAHRRDGVMLRHVIIMMVRNLLDWADHEFAQATASSLDRARQLYELAQEILNSPDLGDQCHRAIRELTIEIVTSIGLDPAGVAGTIVVIIEGLNQIDEPKIIAEALGKIRKVIPDDGTIDPSPIEKIVEMAINKYQSGMNPEKLSDVLVSRNVEMATYEDQVLKDSALPGDNGVSPHYFTYSGNNSFGGILAGVNSNEGRAYTNPVKLCIPPNPVLVALDSYIKLSLLKFQLCLDITGEPLPQVVINDESVAEFFDTVNAEAERTPLLDLPANWFNEPPRYRYSYLIEKARQYTELAQRIGSTLLNTYEKYDNEKLAILKAQHAIELASSTIDLRNLGLKDAVTGLELANLQSDRAENQLEFWQKRIDEGMLSDTEQQAILLSQVGIGFQAAAAAIQYLMVGPATLGVIAGGASSIVGAGTAIAGIASGGTVSLAGLGAIAGGVGVIAASIATGGQTFAGALQSTAGALSSAASLGFTQASFERRFEDWNLQMDLSDFDLKISETQVESATHRIDIADQELTISKLQNTQAKEVLSFLENKFSNEHLYEWMIQVLSQNYRTLMQISANVAKQAQYALEFERQESLTIIAGDYWSISSVVASSANLSEKQRDSGLLGAERLLTDITRLDAYKLSTEKRRLQLSKTISMAQMLPGDLAQLRTTGKVTFNTLMRWFDQDFPGHYLRLIKSVKISMLALTPPVDGIHATLSNSGESTVMVKDGLGFKPIRSFRSFGETIALDSPFNETGLFTFNYEDPMLLPFEGLGVETQWVLELPKASNRFNFDTLVDVMFTIEYTAFLDEGYAQTVKDALDGPETNDLPINARLQYPDEWYHFKNDPPASDGKRKLTINLPKHFLPTHYEKGEDVSAIHVTVMLMGNFEGLSAHKRKQLLESLEISHEYVENGTTRTLKLISRSGSQTGETKFITKLIQPDNELYAMFSTRDNDHPLNALGRGIDPVGDWEISITEVAMPDNTTLGDLIEDILLVVTSEGTVNRT